VEVQLRTSCTEVEALVTEVVVKLELAIFKFFFITFLATVCYVRQLLYWPVVLCLEG